MSTTISTGSKSVDSLLGGGVHKGMITDIYGESGSGKSQLCFTLCSNNSRTGFRTLFIDSAGTFRPERIAEISGSHLSLEKISYIRVLTTKEQSQAVRKITEIRPSLVIVDTLTSLYSVEYTGPARHLALMNYLHNLAVIAISSGCAVVVTNLVRTEPMTVADQAGRNVTEAIIPSHQREYLGNSVSILSHMRVKLLIAHGAKPAYQAILVQPPRNESVNFSIDNKGISDC